MDPAHLRAFAERSRAEVEQRKLDHWSRTYREQGFQATLQAGHALYDHARRVRPDFPTERERAEDLAHHIELKRLLERAAGAFAVR
ncbi:hypothetical protein [Sorangium sp. So ce1078]|uniref:hypothetical protein n=1 Tax=Sorangium sp. So ce1078 TaxID=3133329 RepID=UPI003F605939